MVTLKELMEITEVDHLTVYAPMTDRVRYRIDINPNDSDEKYDVLMNYGERAVRTVWPMYKGDVRMIVEMK